MRASRTGFGLVTAAALMATAACGGGDGGGSSAAGDKSLSVVMWGGSAQEAAVAAYVEPWGEKNGVKILQDQPTDYAKLRAQVESGKVSWGIVQAEPNFIQNACKEGLLEKIDTSVVDTSVVSNPELVSECGVLNMQYAFNIAYNTDEFPDAHPTTWAEFFDTEQFPGKRGFWKYASGGIFEAALLADGVKPEDLYPLDIDRAFKKLDTIKDDLVFYDTGDQQVQMLASGEAPLIQAWNGRVFDAANDGQPVANEFNEHLLAYEQLVIPKGYPQADLAQEWLGQFVTDLEGQAAATEATAYAPMNDDALELVDKSVLPALPTSEENAAKMSSVMDYKYWAENYDAVSERFNEWLAS
jgi:putative spermidine/putrescine transport system substrate-binding protein